MGLIIFPFWVHGTLGLLIFSQFGNIFYLLKEVMLWMVLKK